MIERVRRVIRTPKRDSQSNAGKSYSIGYGKPPRQHRFRPGHSGNPKGRPMGKKNTATLVREILDRKIEVRSGGTTRKVTVREGILTGFAQASLKGDTKSAAFLLQRYDQPVDEQEAVLIGEEEEILAVYAEDYLKKRPADK